MTEKESEAEMRKSRCLARRCDTSILLPPPHPSSPTPVPNSSLSNAQSTPKKKKQKGQVRETEITELECWQIQSGQRRTGNGTDHKLHTAYQLSSPGCATRAIQKSLTKMLELSGKKSQGHGPLAKK